MPRSTAKHSDKNDSKAATRDSKRQPGPTFAEREAAKREEALKDQIKQLRETIVVYISTMKQHQKLQSWQFATKPWDDVESDLAKIDHNHGDLSKAEEAMRNLNIRATNLFIDELERQVNLAKKTGEDVETVRATETNYERMKKNRGKFVLPAKKHKGQSKEDEVD